MSHPPHEIESILLRVYPMERQAAEKAGLYGAGSLG
jgi:hypothetical protein